MVSFYLSDNIGLKYTARKGVSYYTCLLIMYKPKKGRMSPAIGMNER